MTPDGESFAGGVLAHLPALLALGAPSVASYLRLVPQHWAGAYACWGLENREAALRLVTGSAGSEPWAANLEVKCVDLHANPYLLLAGVLAAGADATPLPEPVDVDPASLGDDELGAPRGGPAADDAAGVARRVRRGRGPRGGVRAAARRLDRRGARVRAGGAGLLQPGTGGRRLPLGALTPRSRFAVPDLHAQSGR